jgi:hypothetical protein
MTGREASHDKTVSTEIAAFDKCLVPFLPETQRSTSTPSSLSLPVRYIRMLLGLGKIKSTYLSFTPQETPEKPREPGVVAAFPQDIDLSFSRLPRRPSLPVFLRIRHCRAPLAAPAEQKGHGPAAARGLRIVLDRLRKRGS